ncbi:zonadhesin-like isoform 10-T10 [Discoglossus pictus]
MLQFIVSILTLALFVPQIVMHQSCLENQVYKTCGTKYPSTCDNYMENMACIHMCAEGCFCKDGLVLLKKDSNICVEKSKCPNKVCPENMEFNPCGTLCPKTCENKDRAIKCMSGCSDKKCFCKEGYVLLKEDANTCVKESECPGKVCPENQVYKTCGTKCPSTCDNYMGNMSCIDMCAEGCFCKDGLVLFKKDSNICVEKSKCPKKVCPENQVYKTCGTKCPSTCDNYMKDMVCIHMCAEGCFCKDGLVLLEKDSNICVEKSKCPNKDCPENMEFNPCGTLCPKTCENKDRAIKCMSGCSDQKCFCKEGYVLLKEDANTCVKESECPGKDCPENMEFNPCGTLCPKTCENKDRAIKCMSGCSDQKCFCKEGYVLLKEDANTCVKESECPGKVCPENQVYKTCGTKCPSTCDNYMKDMVCIGMCAEGCFCKDGLVLLEKDSNICVEKSKCPNKDCPENMEFNPCGTLCPKTCENKDRAIKCMSGCSDQKCFCKEGYVLLKEDANTCVKESECPGKDCPENMEFNPCGTLCPKTCENKDRAIKCMSGCSDQKCFCKEGYVLLKEDANTCVKESECPGKVCPENQVYKTCGTKCPSTCDNYMKDMVCILMCAEGCFCKDGLVLLEKDSNICVEKSKCPNKDCPENMEFNPCGTLCPKTCENKDRAIKCMSGCSDQKCFCKEGYVLLKEDANTCVKESECPGKVCPENQVYKTCGTKCPSTCDNYMKDMVCILMCAEGCFCKDGLVLLEKDSNICVEKSKCPNKDCPENMEFNPCGTLCPKTCENKDRAIKCMSGCSDQKCFCKEGYVLLKEDANTCVKESECPGKVCPENQVYKTCGTKCPSTCDNYMKDMVCILMCAEGCFCKDGLVLLEKDSNICVEKSKCPNKDCPENMEFNPCGTLCPKTCENKDRAIKCMSGCSDQKCFCKEGYVLLKEDANTCVKESECPGKDCPENMEFNPCGTLCPKTCENKDRAIKCMSGCSDQKCFCKEGYVLLKEDANTCVKESECPGKVCPENQVHKTCGTKCPSTCDNYMKDMACIAMCAEGCFCKDGLVLLKKDSNICVEKSKCPNKVCPENQVYKTCGTKCPSTCDNYMKDMACIHMCAEGCFCKDGLVLLKEDSNICVEKNKCPNKDCPENMEFTTCGTLCPKTCENKDVFINCLAGCSDKKCICKEGYVLLNQSSNICVTERECPVKVCPENQVYKSCGTKCPSTCDNYMENMACIAMCAEGCFCKDGFVLLNKDSNICVEKSKCPNKVCPENQVYKTCGTKCPSTCDNDMKDMVCIDMCAEGCFCKDGLVLLNKDSNICVEKSKCPNKDCPENMEFNHCGTLCPRTCDNKDYAMRCIAGCSKNKCFCKEGYVLLNQNSNICVKEKECPVKDCPENMEFKFCGTLCPRTCDNKDYAMRCIAGCSKKKCFCKEGYVLLNQNSNICVKERECPVKDCPENMEFKFCGTLCPRTCDNKDYAMRCIAGCSKKKCFCKEGYVLLNQNSNICVKKRECPVKDCPENMEYKSCGTLCPRTCDNKDYAMRCIAGCSDKKCFCKEGYVLLNQNSNICVKERECPVKDCPENMEFHSCGTLCPRTCDNKDYAIRCIAGCSKKKCFCKEGYVLLTEDSNTCVKESVCPVKEIYEQ